MKTFLIFLIACFGYSDYFTGKSMQTRPLVLGPLVGLALGNLEQGVIIGATMELAMMGAVGIGAALPPEVVSGGILGTAFAIIGHKDAGMAVALGLPIAMLVMLLRNLLFIAIDPIFAKRADKYDAKGDIEGVNRMHWFGGVFGMYLPLAILVTVSFQLGGGIMQQVLNMIPKFIQTGLSISAGILPALGFAILLRMIVNKEIIGYLIVGFVLTAYLKLPVVGVALLAVGIIAILLYVNKGVTTRTENSGGDSDDDF